MGKVFGTSAIALVCIRILAYYACAVEACSCMRVLEKNLREMQDFYCPHFLFQYCEIPGPIDAIFL